VSLFDTIETNVGPPDIVSPSTRRAAMLEHPTLAVAAIQKGRIRETNAPWKALFALPPDVSVESHVATLFPNVTSADRFERALQAELTPAPAGGATARSEHLLMRRDGSAFLAEVVVWLIDAEDSERPLGGDAVWQVRDITVERTLRRELRDLEDYHRELSRHQWDMTFVIDRKGRISYASSSIEGALGYRVHAMLGEPFASLLDPDHAAEAEQWLRAASRRQAGGQTAEAGDGFALRVMHNDGSVRVLTCRPRDCFATPRIAGMVIHARDITDEDAGRVDPAGAGAAPLRAALIDMARSPSLGPTERITTLLATIGARLDAAVVTLWEASDEAGERRWVPHTERREGAESVELLPLLSGQGDAGEGPLVLDDLQDAAARFPAVETALRASSLGALVEIPVLDEGRHLGWLAVATASPRSWLDAEVDFLVGSALLFALATKRGAVVPDRASSAGEEAFDALRGLPGRVAAERHVADLIAGARPGVPPVVLSLGIDHLRDINDGLGLAAGDAVISRTAAALVDVAGPDAFVARIGGDEFLVVLQGLDAGQVDGLVQTILARVAEPGGAGVEPVSVEASVGLAGFTFDNVDASALMQQADLAMREAKRRGGAQAFSFNARLVAAIRTQKELDGEIEEALSRNEFTIFYQPQIALGGGEVVGLEALVRWEHPTRGLLLPDAFIGSAFKRGLIDALTKMVLTQVCEQIAAWRRVGNLPELPIAVNVSGRQFHDRRLPALVASALLKSGLPARLLVLEITEQSLIGNEAGIERVVKELSRLGVRIAISDFNVGHASFKYLKQLSVSQIKLDQGFVKGLPDDPESVIFVAAFVDLARRLKYQVIAEGVETREQFVHLREIGCDVGQGFYLGAPLSAAEIQTFVEANRKKPVH